MKQSLVPWPKLFGALALFLVAGIILWIFHVLLHDSVGVSLLLLSVLSMLAFFLTVLLMAIKFFKLIWPRKKE